MFFSFLRATRSDCPTPPKKKPNQTNFRDNSKRGTPYTAAVTKKKDRCISHSGRNKGKEERRGRGRDRGRRKKKEIIFRSTNFPSHHSKSSFSNKNKSSRLFPPLLHQTLSYYSSNNARSPRSAVAEAAPPPGFPAGAQALVRGRCSIIRRRRRRWRRRHLARWRRRRGRLLLL